MALPVQSHSELVAVLAAAPLVGLPILDTTLVVISRLRRGVQVLSGSRDHVTHRLRFRLGSVRKVAGTLAIAQAGLCGLSLGLLQAGTGLVVAAAVVYGLAALVAIYALDTPWHPGRRVHSSPATAVREEAAA
jgi:hypothetical protein